MTCVVKRFVSGDAIDPSHGGLLLLSLSLLLQLGLFSQYG